MSRQREKALPCALPPRNHRSLHAEAGLFTKEKAQDMLIFFSRQNVEATLALTSVPRVSPALEETFSEALPSNFTEFRPFLFCDLSLFADGLDPEKRLMLVHPTGSYPTPFSVM